jgi:hypothetical protein
MRHSVDPRQNQLFDPFLDIIPPLGRQRIDTGWQAIMRHCLLELMPVRQIGAHFHPTFGRPTKELYSMAGLMLLQELNNWTNPETVEAYLFRTDVQFALNLEPGSDQMCDRTWERYRALFIEDELAHTVMDAVTRKLVDELDLKIDSQRLDSTHVFSNMARFGRTRLLAITNKRFLTQVARHFPDDFAMLPEDLRKRYAPSTGTLFSDKGKSSQERDRSRQQAAEDMHELIERFADHSGLNTRPSYKALVTVFGQQCELIEAKVRIRPKSGVCVQNTSDPDATFDYHKGVGYKAQLTETCADENDVQLIVSALVQTASAKDAEALPAVLEDLRQNERLPESMLADTSFGGDGNVQAAAALGVELTAPVGGQEVRREPDDPVLGPPLTMEDFACDERTGEVTACPAGRVPLQVLTDEATDEITIEMHAADCQACPFAKVCPVKKRPGERYTVKYTAKQRRVEERRREQATAAFRERYSKRSGIESTNGGLKRRLGFGRLRVRGMKAVSHALYLKIAGWNLLRAAYALKQGRFEVRKGLHERLRRWLRLTYRPAWIMANYNKSRDSIQFQLAFE